MPIDLHTHPAIQKTTIAEPIVTCPERVDIDVIIGNELIGSDRMEFTDGLILLDSKLGLTPTGKLALPTSCTDACAMMFSAVDMHPAEDFDLQKFWELEEVGIGEDTEKSND